MTVRSMRATLASGRTIIAGRRSEPRTDGQVPAVAADTLDAATIACNVEVAREIYASRRRRHKFLPVDLFGEPT